MGSTKIQSPLIVLASQMLDSDRNSVTDDVLLDQRALAVNFFVRCNVVGLTTVEIADLVSRDPDASDGRQVRVHAYAKQLFTFATAPVGTIVVTRTRRGERYLVGRLTSAYQYDPSRFADHPHIREVSWLAHLPRGTALDGNRRTTVRHIADERVAATIMTVALSDDLALTRTVVTDEAVAR